MTRDPTIENLRTPGFAGEDPNVFDDRFKVPRVVALVVGADGQPLAFGGGSGSSSDPASARETTLQQVRDAVGTLATQASAEGLHVRPPVIATLAPQALSVGSAPTPLTVPAGANAATVHVVSGSVRRSIGGAPGAGTPGLSVGDSEDIQGAELAAYRLIRDGSSDAGLHVEYRTVG